LCTDRKTEGHGTEGAGLRRIAALKIIKRQVVTLGAILLVITVLAGDALPFEVPEDSTYSEEYTYALGPRITNIFYESDIRDALRDISVQSGIPIVADPTVQGFVTLEVENVPLEECLRRLLGPGGFTFRQMDGYYLVGAAYPENPAFVLLSETKRIKPSYLKAAEVPGLLSPFYEPFVRIDAEANVVVVTASPEIIDRVLADLAEIDVPPKQVMIEALVTEISTTAMRQVGIDWRVIGTGPDYLLSLSQLVSDASDSTLRVSYKRESAAKYGNMDVSVYGAIQALAESGELKVHANPRVVTLDGQPAHIFLGREEYYEIITGPVTYAYTRLEVIKVGITLAIKPYIGDNGDITVEIQPEVSDVMGTGFTEDFPVVLKRNVSTEVRVKDGETITIGGLVMRTETERETKVPLLGDIPILGHLFKTSSPSTQESEIVVFITPHILQE
jgi:type II secretory pathway component GspD/PulD (secretin)